MRETARCPKCRHTEIVYLPELLVDSNPSGNLLAAQIGILSPKRYPIEAYICRGCGYTELYTPSASDLPINKIEGARLLRAEDTPYR